MKLFNFDYPCMDAAWKSKLEDLFVRSYYFNEIGFETIDRFLYELETKFKTIMPYYNDLYKTTLLSIDPLITSKVSEVYNATSKTTDSSAATNTDEITDYEYPQNADELTDIAAGRKVATNKVDNSGSNNNINDYERVITGLSGDQSALLKSYRANIININQMIIKECKNLFILIY